MIIYTTAKNKEDLEGIFALQKANLKINLSAQEIEKDGFVTVSHSYKSLEILNAIEPHIIAKDGDLLVGYILAMTKQSKFEIPIIIPMFKEFEKIPFKNSWVSNFDYMVVGQVCIHKNYRGQGVFEKCFQLYKNSFAEKYNFSITEIAETNYRSRKAHSKVGFKEIHSYQDANKNEWVIVLWDWNSTTAE